MAVAARVRAVAVERMVVVVGARALSAVVMLARELARVVLRVVAMRWCG